MKHMKKSMFITTLIMTVVLVVALSTATFAWYTANTNVTSNVVEVYTAQSTAASIVVSSGTYTGPSMDNTTMNLTINAGSVGNGIQPMIPRAAFAIGETPTAYSSAKASSFFNTANVGVDGNFLAAGADTAPAIITTTQAAGGTTPESPANTQDYFYVVNTSDSAHTISVNVVFADSYKSVSGLTSGTFAESKTSYYTKSGTTYTPCTNDSEFNGETTYYVANATLKNALRVAIFANDSCIAVYSSSTEGNNTYKYGAITASTASSSFGTTASTIQSGNATNLTSSTAAYGAVKVSVVAWYEGLAITNAYTGQSAGFNLVFTAA